MLGIICAVAVSLGQGGPFNYTGKLTSLMNEDTAWGMPQSGLSIPIVIEQNGLKVGPASFSLKGPRWKNEAKFDLGGLKFSSGALTGTIDFKNSSGLPLDAVRFDVVSAVEHYKQKGADGLETLQSRPIAVVQESPILLGDMPQDSSFGGVDFKASGLAWKPETVDITVEAKLSGLAMARQLFNEQWGSNLDMDSKGRLIIGSGDNPGIYRGNPETLSCDLLASMSNSQIKLSVNPVDGTICARAADTHEFNFYTAAGDDLKVLPENDDLEGMNSWPNFSRYDAKGALFLGFGAQVSKMNGDKPAFYIAKQGQFDFGNPFIFDLGKDGSIYINSVGNIFKFDPTGKVGKRLIQGPSEKLGRMNGSNFIRLDPAGQIWVGDECTNQFPARACVFDKEGKFVWVFGRGGDVPLEDAAYPGGFRERVTGIAFSGDGRVYVSTGDPTRGILEFAIF